MIRVAMVLHREQPAARLLAGRAAEWLKNEGHVAWPVDIDQGIDAPEELGTAADIRTADLILSLGGDGTMLRAVRLIEGNDIPLLGVNLGQLGYLTEVEEVDMLESLRRFSLGPSEGGWTLDDRMMLEVVGVDSEGRDLGPWTVLNEVTVEKAGAGESIRFLLHIDDEPFTSYATDGLIVSTPTGSTAYALSARGPVISPRHRAMLVTPVAPHQLFDRSLVLDPSESVLIELTGHREAMVVADGLAVCSLSQGAKVICRPSDRTARFVRFGHRPYHQILKAKFRLTDR